MKPRSGVGVLVAAFALGGCAERDSSAPGVTVADSAGISIVTSVRDASAPLCTVGTDPAVSIGMVAGDEPYQLYRVFGARRLGDGRIVVANQGSNELRFYDVTGAHLFSVGREGEGPGEFENVFGLWRVDGDTLWAGDYRPWRYNVFGPDGEWVRTVQPDPLLPNSPRQWGMFSDGSAFVGEALTVRDDFRTPTPLALRVHDPEGGLIRTIDGYEYGTWGTIGESNLGIYVLFDGGARSTAAGEVMAISTADVAEIRILDREAELLRLIRWNEPDRSVTDADVSAQHDRLLAEYADLDPALVRELTAPLVSDERPVAERFPTLAELQLGADGRLWVRRYPRPRDESRSRWMVFDTDGAWACDVVLPDGFEFYDAGADYVLGGLDDELGVERVVLFEVSDAARDH